MPLFLVLVTEAYQEVCTSGEINLDDVQPKISCLLYKQINWIGIVLVAY